MNPQPEYGVIFPRSKQTVKVTSSMAEPKRQRVCICISYIAWPFSQLRPSEQEWCNLFHGKMCFGELKEKMLVFATSTTCKDLPSVFKFTGLESNPFDPCSPTRENFESLEARVKGLEEHIETLEKKNKEILNSNKNLQRKIKSLNKVISSGKPKKATGSELKCHKIKQESP
eukprot:Gregarina_sp_Poly_1__4249@NODE_2316_length_2304_cov_26_439428_g1483_i0_p1_GENE_NODE_2316_length_2304_cov_26_439428_g1483_i0NODE_2316_length_2304_cov_26_439428_g1483_i0_p1_ORF_typecomplete_len172_score23_15XhlA/PF10779_9/0_0002YabA/PF06156_13/0_0021ZapB/PF06005_12/0_0026NRBF2/PF08961_10/0_0024DUF4795/PF16043_5/0_0028Leu_zip/PF15294_6/0_003GIT_CC/PF16559_5/0_003HMMR_N/PF15905_5/0_0045bZIP_1/PF00170_21/0_008KASH_CCD/PF14662_6/0_0051HMMR_C/PF15908_5/0_0077CENPF_leu_zip/PF10473_9/0_01DUF3450/PF11932_